MFAVPSYDVIVSSNVHGEWPRSCFGPNLSEGADSLIELSILEALINHDIEGIRIHCLEGRRSVVVQHLVKHGPSLGLPPMLQQDLYEDVASGRNHPKLPIEQRLIRLHSLLLSALIEEPVHERSAHNSIIDQTPLFKLIEQLVRLVQISQVEKTGNQIVINQRISSMTLSQHLAQKIDRIPHPAGIDEPLGEMPISDGRGTKRRMGQDMAIDLESGVDVAHVAVGVDQIIVRDDVGDDVGLVEEELEEGNGVGVPLAAVHGGDDGVASEDGGAGVGEDGVAGDGGGGIEIAGADEGLDAVVEIEAGADEGGGGVGEAGGVGIALGRRVVVAAEGVERGLDAEAAFAAAAFGGGLLGGAEGEGAVLSSGSQGGEEVEVGGGGGGGGAVAEGAEEDAVEGHGDSR